MQLFNFHFKRTKVIALLTGLLALFLVINYYTQLNIIALEFAAGCTNKNMIRPTRPLAVLFGDSITQQGFIPENHGLVCIVNDVDILLVCTLWHGRSVCS